MKKLVTVFTPVYNRADILPVLYHSLLRQTNRNFVWLIVDDGSQDNVAEIVGNWVKEETIEIRFYRQENGGKHRAHNWGTRLCETDWFVCVDSDEWLEENAVESFYSDLKSLDGNYIGIIYPKTRLHSGLPKRWFPKGIQNICASDIYIYLKSRVETVILLRTRELNMVEIPHIQGENFMGESILLSRLSEMGEFFPVYKSVCLFEYYKDGLTRKGANLWVDNPMGTLVMLNDRYSQLLSSKRSIMRKNTAIIKCIMHINAFCIATHRKIKQATPNAVLSIILFAPSVLFSLYRYNEKIFGRKG